MALRKCEKVLPGAILRTEDGYTLIELIVYLVIAGMILGSVVLTFLGQSTTFQKQDAIAEIQQNIRGALNVIASEIRFAGFDPEALGAGITSAEHDSLSFSYWVDPNADGNYADVIFRPVSYSHEDDKFLRWEGLVKPPLVDIIVAENIDKLGFEYMYWDPDDDEWKWAINQQNIKDVLGVSADKALERIRAVKIIMLGSTRESAFSSTDQTAYQPHFEDPVAPAENWTPEVNTGIKRMMSVIVECRNSQG